MKPELRHLDALNPRCCGTCRYWKYRRRFGAWCPVVRRRIKDLTRTVCDAWDLEPRESWAQEYYHRTADGR